MKLYPDIAFANLEMYLEFSRAYVCQESSPMGAFSNHRSWMK